MNDTPPSPPPPQECDAVILLNVVASEGRRDSSASRE